MQCMKVKIWVFQLIFMIVPFFKEQLDTMKMIPCGYHRYYYRQQEMLAHGLEEYSDPVSGNTWTTSETNRSRIV